MVVSACGKESGCVSQALDDVETEDSMIKTYCPFQVGDLEMHVSNTDACVNRHISN
jgi:hypothetical protein